MLTPPGFDVFTHPAWDALSQHAHEDAFALRLDLFAQPLKTSRSSPNLASRHKTQVHVAIVSREHPVTGEGGCRSGSFLSKDPVPWQYYPNQRSVVTELEETAQALEL